MKKKSLVLVACMVLTLFYLLSGVIVEASDHTALKGLIGKYYTENPTKYGGSTEYLKIEDALIATRFEDNGTIFNIKDALYGLNEDTVITKVVWEGKITPTTTGTYYFNAFFGGTDYKVPELSLSINGSSLAPSGNEWSMDLVENTPYTFTIRANTKVINSELPDDIVIQWKKSEDGIYESIAPEYLETNLTDFTNIFNVSFDHLKPVYDYDDDGIPNIWETEGFVRIGDKLEKYDPNKDSHEDKEVYYTSPYAWSTDGDPYSDREEVETSYITGVGGHPLVAAFPEVVARVNSITASATYGKTMTETGTTLSQTTTFSGFRVISRNSSTSSNTHGFNVGLHVGVEGGFKVKGPIPGAYLNVENSVSGEHRYTLSNSNSTTLTTVAERGVTENNGIEDFIGTLIEHDTGDAGTLAISVAFQNIGTAPIYNCVPTVTVYVGESAYKEVVKTSALPILYNLDIGIKSGYSTYQTEAFKGGTRQKRLTIDRELVEKVKNYPVGIETISNDGDVIVNAKITDDGMAIGDSRGKWTDYKAGIEAVTATIIRTDSSGKTEKYRVYANDNTPDSPYVSIYQALKLIFGTRFTIEAEGPNSKKFKIKDDVEGEEVTTTVTGLTLQTSNKQEQNELNDIPDDKILDIGNVTLTPDMVVTITTSTPQTSNPIILNATYNQSKITATVLPNGDPISDVQVIMNIDNEERTINLVPNEDLPNVYTYSFDEEPIIDVDYANKVIARTKVVQTEQELYIANAASVRDRYRAAYGLRFTRVNQIMTRSEIKDYMTNNHNPTDEVVYVLNRDNYQVRTDSSHGETILVEKPSDLDKHTMEHFMLSGYYSTKGNLKFIPFDLERRLYLSQNEYESKFQLDLDGLDASMYLVNVGTAQLAYNRSERMFIDVNSRQLGIQDVGGIDTFYQYNSFAYVSAKGTGKMDIKLRRYDLPDNNIYRFHLLGYFTDDPDQIGSYYNRRVNKVDKNGEDVRDITVGNRDGRYNQKKELPAKDGEKTLDYQSMEGLMLKIEKTAFRDQHAYIWINGVKASFGTNFAIAREKEMYLYVPVYTEGPNQLNITIGGQKDAGNYHITLVGYYN